MTDHKAAKEYCNYVYQSSRPLDFNEDKALENLADSYLDLTAQLAAKDAVIGELEKFVKRVSEIHNIIVSIDGIKLEYLTEDYNPQNLKDVIYNASRLLAKHRESADKGE